MIRSFWRASFAVLTVALVGAPAGAATIDVSTIFLNLGFEDGNLNRWTLTRPNMDYVASLSPPVNPSIDPADVANDPTTLTAPAGTYFTGLKRVGDVGPDLKYKLAHDAAAISVATATVFQVRVWANRGRLEPFDTPASTGDVLVRIFGWTAGAVPTVTASTDNWSRSISWNPAAQTFDFTGVPDGTWTLRTFTFDPALAGRDAATLAYLSVSVTARNNNHDQYVATDLPDQPPLGVEPRAWSSIKALYRGSTH